MYRTDFGESMVMIPTEDEIKVAVEKSAKHFHSKYGCDIEMVWLLSSLNLNLTKWWII